MISSSSGNIGYHRKRKKIGGGGGFFFFFEKLLPQTAEVKVNFPRQTRTITRIAVLFAESKRSINISINSNSEISQIVHPYGGAIPFFG